MVYQYSSEPLMLRIGRVSVTTRWLVQVQLGRSQVVR